MTKPNKISKYEAFIVHDTIRSDHSGYACLVYIWTHLKYCAVPQIAVKLRYDVLFTKVHQVPYT